MRIIIVGFGVVGQSFARMLSLRSSELAKKYGVRPVIVAVVDKGGAAVDVKGINVDRLLSTKRERGTVAADPHHGRPELSALEIINDAAAEVVVELTPTNINDGEPGLSHIMAALKAEKHVITTNKGPLALAFPALQELANHNRRLLRFSGAVGGGTPILDFAKKCLPGDAILSVRGILNGTTNYILSKMAMERVSFDEALAEAQRLGYAERDPSMDIDGLDTACKLVIIANCVMGLRVTLKDVRVEGIRKVTSKAVEEAAAKGYEIKLLGTINGALNVSPQLIPKGDPLCVNGVLNAVTYVSKYAGEETVIGRGAGGVETASAILRDLIEIKRSLSQRYID
ncbi:MAG: homoserine dehydrogenase [Candidatus Bathyarchaeia archaeon]